MFAGGECSSRRLQILLNPDCDRVRGTKHATTYPFRVFERRHGLADIVERGAVVFGERDRRNPPQSEREYITITEDTLRDGYRFAN